MRLRVPFGRRKVVGVLLETADKAGIGRDKLKRALEILEDEPALPPELLGLCRWAAEYYHHPIGEVIATALPVKLREGRALVPARASRKATAATVPDVPPALNSEQAEALAQIEASLGRFQPLLLEGVTGSGKTEIYLRAISRAVAAGKQVLVLVPEIGLTPQFVSRFRARLGENLVLAHSGLAAGERLNAWLAARAGEAAVVIGTRSAVFTPMPRLGLIIVDEEHDTSYKQQEGLRYSARDLAVRRAQRLGIPVILGSATPSLESYSNARDGKYALARLASRATTGAAMPAVRTVDTRADRPHDGLTYALTEAVRARIARGEQSLIFVNRRGFSPVLFCRACSWHSTCTRCSANLVLHLRDRELRCHHCGHRERIPKQCPSCAGTDLAPIGHGTQRVEEALQAAFPTARIARIDRDSTARKGSLGGMLKKVRDGEIDILVGTQMLAKGHDYPKLTLVGVLDSDSALFSADFRAAERLFSQLVQVSGRAGRADRAGEVLIQTDFPTHPIYAAVATQDYERFAAGALDDRRIADFPPFAHLALLRAESKKSGEAASFLEGAVRCARRISTQVEVFDPVPAPLERKAGFERAQLLVRGRSRATLQPFLQQWKAALAETADRRVRWSLDVDPQEV
jgi:primosomal protein N' (replication factor Y)